MTRQHHNSIAATILKSTQRLLRSNRNSNLLASSHIDARTMKDIGINPVGMF
ncbi:MAG: hypothetical protein AAGA00_08930 [Pseudomonadota bacterium]